MKIHVDLMVELSIICSLFEGLKSIIHIYFQGIRFLRKLTESRHLLAYKTRQLNDATGYYGYLSIEGDPVNINEKVVMEGFASKRPSLGARGGGDTFNPSTSNHVPGHCNSLGSGDRASMFGSNSSLNNYMTNESGYGQRSRSSINGAIPGHQGVQKPQYPGRSPQRNINMPPAFNVPPPLMGARYPSPTKGTDTFYHTNSGESISSQQRYRSKLLIVMYFTCGSVHM